MNQENLIIIDHGRRFEGIGLIFSVLALVMFSFFVLLTYWAIILFVIVLLATLYILTNSTRVEIDINSNKIRLCFSSIYGDKGEWQDFSKYESLSILTTKKASRLYSYRGNSEFFSESVSYKTSDIYFMDKNHWKRIYLKSFTDYQKSKEFANELSNKTGKPLYKYSPVTTRKRR